jgi:outer membrane receptor protein involved in Fe transport
VFAAGALLSSQAFAQYPQQPATDAESGALQEIIVTASKRETTLQTTPMSITAATGQDLLNHGISNVEDLALQTPGLAITSQGPGRTVFTMRGMSPTGGAAPTVGYYIDETPVTPPSEALSVSGKNEIDPNLYDLARAEVLRGPQGTLYGAGSMGGTIRLITNQPKLGTFEASAQAIGSGTEHGGFNYAENGMVNLPLGDKFALRLVEGYRFDDGYIDRVVIPNFPLPTNGGATRGDVLAATPSRVYSNVNDVETKSVRLTLLGQVTDSFTIKPSIYYQGQFTGGQDSVDVPPDNLAHYQPFDIAEPQNDEFTIYSFVAKYDGSAFSVQSATALTTRYNSNTMDESETEYSLFGFGALVPGPSFTNHESRETSEELRVTSSTSGPFQWLAGAFYDKFTDQLRYAENQDAFTPVFGTGQIFDFYEKDTLKQYAFFGEASYKVIDPLTVTLGLRYFHYDFDFLQDGAGIVVPPISEHVLGEASDQGFNPKVNLSYIPMDGVMYYVTASKGFRPGAPNGPIPTTNLPGAACGDALAALGLKAAPGTYSPDTVWSYELGGKFDFLQRRLQVDADIYHLNWDNIQQSVVLPCGFSFTANAGKAQADGAEVEITAKIGAGFSFSQGMSYVDARIVQHSVNTGSGDRLAGVPEWTLNSSLEYAHPLVGNWQATARLSDQFTARELDPSAEPYPINYRPGFNTVDGRIGAKLDKFSASLFIQNLTDRRAYLGFAPTQEATIPSMTRAIPLRPRTAGVDIQWSF